MSSVAGDADGLPFVGCALSIAERAALQSSIPLLSARHETHVRFWGKVLGYKGDYLVAQAMPDGVFGKRFSFFSGDGGTSWRLLDPVTEDEAAFCDQLRGVYMGDPTFMYKVRRDIPPEPEPTVAVPDADEALTAAREKYGAAEEGKEEGEEGGEEEEEEEEEEGGAEEQAEEEEEEDDEEQHEEQPKKKRPKFMILAVPETVRLAHFIQLHDAACTLVVRGQYVFTPNGGGASKNVMFAGQPVRHAMKPSCYLRAFHPGRHDRNRILYGPTYSSVTDQLSPITDDEPQGVWVVKYDPTASMVTVQNLFFNGSLFWYRPGTSDSGQVYCGNGERDFEVCFLL
ncbi:radial spoke head protein 9 [Trypanosoma conorhini]|uniref:Radial spoke head protein 9 n=1 Tax=Trypanosoma conorhini TaxID=83891 RepID=A0A3S5ITR8_9TRYP|nr:radial spoke head protein 9 [Trypanosoma conorhini]RNF23014.1 radial spoke head protein 9 [Trypanosoma conorhini]